MQLSDLYGQSLEKHGFESDSSQLRVIESLQRISDYLNQPLVTGWRNFFATPEAVVPGLYLWGGVGRGKTWVMDLFFDHLEEPKKGRLHFHRFMQRVHADLTAIKGQADPLKIVARKMASEWRVLCLDEFHVVDIGDAVIFAGLLRSLFAENMVLITTSNVPPDELYKDGIQRASFLPAIDLLNEYTEVLPMGGNRDYRQEILTQEQTYHWPLNDKTERTISEEFSRMATTAIQGAGELDVNGRSMPYLKLADGMVWFDFEALCGPPRSKFDYIELSRCQHTIFISNIPAMGTSRDDRTRRFIFLIDEFYDRKVKLVISAEVAVEKLYMGERLAFEFQRTLSRIREMQTPVYLGSPHKG